MLRYAALIVDDRVTDANPERRRYCWEAAHLLQGWNWDVYLTPTLKQAAEQHFWRANRECTDYSIEPANENKLIALEHFEVIFLDIARPAAAPEGKNAVSIEGIRHDLLALSRIRSVLRFPQIYMLSHISGDRIAHLCHALGADYYFEKDEFRLLSKDDFESILGHTIWLARGDSDMALRGSGGSSDSVSGTIDSESLKYGWTPDSLFSNTAGDLSAYAIQNYALVKHFFSREHDINAIKFVKRYGEGFSGAVTLEVQPVKVDDAPEAPHEKMQKARVVKIANLYELGRELAAYARHVQPYTSAGFARVEPYWAVNHGRGVIAYERAGEIPSSSVIMLDKWLSENKGGDNGWEKTVSAVLDKILNALPPLHASGRISPKHRPMRDIWIYFRTELQSLTWPGVATNDGSTRCFSILATKGLSGTGKGPESAVAGFETCEAISDLRAWGISEDGIEDVLGPEELLRPGKQFDASVAPTDGDIYAPATVCLDAALRRTDFDEKHIGCLKQLRKYVDSLKIPRRMEQWAACSFGNSESIVAWGPIHGDLRLGNIMFEESTESIWIIDYGKAGEGPVALDYIHPAFDVRLRCIAPLIAAKIGDAMASDDWFCAVINTIKMHEENLSRAEASDWQSKWVARLYQRAGKHFEPVEALFLLRVLQKYKAETKTPAGLVILIWAAWLLDKRLSDAGYPATRESGL
ncbi:MAG: hypothetical protein JW832_06485 [Deltaproteobacteria bacterium]|nr:hypothetical protein [Deltaproteobacteria bacterium]